MKEIIESIQRLSTDYERLAENSNQIFYALKVRDYKKKETLESAMKQLYEQKNQDEIHLIELVKETAESLGLEEKRIESILSVHPNEEEKMLVRYELEKMLKNIYQFQFNLKRNIEFAAIFLETKAQELEIMFEAIQREGLEQGGPLLLNKEY